MFDRLRQQVDQFVADRRVRPRLVPLEDRTVLTSASSQLLDFWFDGTYGMSTLGAVGPQSAKIGLSTVDPVTGAEQQLYSETVPAYNGVAVSALQLATTADGRPLLFGNRPVLFESNPTRIDATGEITGTPGSVVYLGNSRITIVDGAASRTITRDYRVLAVGQAADGSLLASWAEGGYSTNPYGVGSGSASVGVSSFNPATGVERVLFSEAVPANSTRPYRSTLTPVLQFDADGKPLLAGGKFVMLASDTGAGSYGFGTPTDDASVVWLADPTTKTSVKFATTRETREVVVDADGALLASWYDGTYGTNPYSGDSAVVGVSRLNPSTLAETVLFSQKNAAVVGGYEPQVVLTQNGHTLRAGGRTIVAVRQPGRAGATPQDDRTAIYALNSNAAPKLLRTDNRDLRQIGARDDGAILVNWFDGTYGTNPYGQPSSAMGGISRIDPNTGAETKLVTTPTQTYSQFGPTSTMPLLDLLIEANGRVPTVNGRTIASTTTYGGTSPSRDEASSLLILADNGTSTKLASQLRRIDTLGVSGDGGVLAGWFDGTYSNNPYGGPDSAIRGVSRIDAATGAEQELFRESVPASPNQPGAGFGNEIEFVEGANGLPYLNNGKTFVHRNSAGASGYDGRPYYYSAVKDDTSSIVRLNGTTTTTIAARPRESLALLPVEFAALLPTPNTPPALGAIADQIVVRGKAMNAVSFTLADAESPNTLVLRATSSNATLVPASTIAFGGSGSSRTVTLTPAAGQTGSSLITITATDAGGMTATETFTVTVPAASKLAGIAREFAVGSDACRSGVVRLYNPDRTERFNATPFGADFTGGIRTASADVTGDGVGDVVVGSGPGIAGRVLVLDGTSGKILFDLAPFGKEFNLGVVVSAGDLTGDGKAEIVITAESGGGARIRVFSPVAAGFVQTADFFGLIGGDGVADTTFRGGGRSAVGDLDGDGFGDLIFAAGAGGGPRIATFGGKSLTPTGGPKLRGDFFAFEPDLRDGTYIAAGDVDGDGKADLVAGAGPGGEPRVTIFAGGDLIQNKLTKLRDFFAGDVTNRGGIRVTVKDLDGDDRADLIVGSGPGDAQATAYAGSTLMSATAAPAFDLDVDPSSRAGIYVG